MNNLWMSILSFVYYVQIIECTILFLPQGSVIGMSVIRKYSRVGNVVF